MLVTNSQLPYVPFWFVYRCESYLEVLISELLTVDRLATATVAISEVTTLQTRNQIKKK